MKELMMAFDNLEAAQMELMKRWLKTYDTLEQQNQFLSQQVDYLESKIAELELKQREARRCPLIT